MIDLLTSLQAVFQSFGENLIQSFAHLSPAVASLLVASVWRGVLLAVVVAIALRMLPRLSAATRSAIWLSVLFAVVALPALSILFPAHAASNVHRGVVHLDPRWSYALVGVWLAFSALRLLQLAVSAWQLRRLAVRAEELDASASLRQILRGANRSVQLCVSTDVDRPSFVGFFRARILIPSELLAKLTESELEQIVLHEVEHLRRYDDWTNLLQKVSVALLPLHPVVVWLDRRLCLERELACDDGVLQATQARTSYAECLTNLAEHSLVRRSVSLALGAVGSWKPKSEVAKRVCRILAKPENIMGRTQARFAVATVLAGVVGGAFALAHTPRLISFASESQSQIAAESSAAPLQTTRLEAPTEHAVMTSASMPVPRAVFAKAVVNAKPARALRAVAKTRFNKPAIQRAQQRVAAPVAEPLFHLTAWHEDDMPAPHFAVAVQEDSQFVYAAVPVRGGWLIVQL